MLIGLVKTIAETPKGYYGFLITPEGSVYFQQMDYQPFCIDVDKDIVTLYGEGHLPEKPKVDDVIYFMKGHDKSGRVKAEAWCTQAEGERIEKILSEGEKFSLTRTRLAPSGKNVTTIWTGYDEELMFYETELKRPLERNNGYTNGVYVKYELQQVSTSNI